MDYYKLKQEENKMKITKIDVFYVDDKEAPSIHPVLCGVYTDTGLYGDGEAAMSYGVGAKAAFGMVQDLANIVVGMDPLENEIIWDKMYRTTFWGQNGGGVFTAGMSAIDIALWDIKGKFFNVPIYTLLGGKLNDNASYLCISDSIRMEEYDGSHVYD